MQDSPFHTYGCVREGEDKDVRRTIRAKLVRKSIRQKQDKETKHETKQQYTDKEDDT